MVIQHHGIAELLMLCVINLDTLPMVGDHISLNYCLITSILLLWQQFSYNAGAIPLHYRLTSANAKLPIWLDNVNCNGNESSLFNCAHGTVGEISTFCDHSDDVGVRCWGESNL